MSLRFIENEQCIDDVMLNELMDQVNSDIVPSRDEIAIDVLLGIDESEYYDSDDSMVLF